MMKIGDSVNNNISNLLKSLIYSSAWDIVEDSVNYPVWEEEEEEEEEEEDLIWEEEEFSVWDFAMESVCGSVEVSVCFSLINPIFSSVNNSVRTWI